MKLRTLLITLLLVCGLTLSVSADSWSDTGLPGQLPPGWSVQGSQLVNAEDSQVQGVIRFLLLEDLTFSLADEVEKIIVENNFDRSEHFSVTYGSTRVEMLDLGGMYFAFARYNGNVYTILLSSQAAETLPAHQDTHLTYIFGPTKQYNERGI